MNTAIKNISDKWIIVVLCFCLAGVAESTRVNICYGCMLQGAPQSPYELNIRKDLPIFAAGISLMLISKTIPSNIKQYNEADLADFSPEDVNRFDRSAIGPSSQYLSDWSWFTNAAAANTVWLLFANENARRDFAKIIVMYAEAYALYPLISLWINPLVARKRPYFYSNEESIENRLHPFAQTSFPSGHANYGFCFAVLFGNLFNGYFPDSRWRYAVWPMALGLATSTAVLRYKGHWHYPTDLIAGAAMGSLIGWFIPWIHKKPVAQHASLAPVSGERFVVNVNINLR